MHNLRLLIPLLPAAFALACATAPPIDLAGTEQIAPGQAAANAEAARGARVAWGGRIVNTQNLKQTTEIEVLGYPLDASGRPDPGAEAQRRFLLVQEGYLESADYRPGRLVSAVGTIGGTREGMVGEARYLYPTLEAEQLYLWPTSEARRRGSNVHFGVGIGVIFR